MFAADRDTPHVVAGARGAETKRKSAIFLEISILLSIFDPSKNFLKNLKKGVDKPF